MNYKKIIKSQKLRVKILSVLSFVPDKTMVKLQYRIKTGRKLNLKDPKRFTEKIQKYKLDYRNPLMHKCADKYGVREYIESKGLKEILNTLYGVYENEEEIDFNKLPNSFVLKTNNSSHTNILCDDKSKLDINETKRKLKEFICKKKKISAGREWAYNDIKTKIICEKYLDKDENGDIVDYKFFCFNGKAYYLYVITNRFLEGGPKLGIYDINGNKTEYRRADMPLLEENIKLPGNLREMKEIAEKLSEDFPHVRVDLYNIKGKIIFGEMTFYDGSGYEGFIPDEFDYILGEKFEI